VSSVVPSVRRTRPGPRAAKLAEPILLLAPNRVQRSFIYCLFIFTDKAERTEQEKDQDTLHRVNYDDTRIKITKF